MTIRFKGITVLPAGEYLAEVAAIETKDTKFSTRYEWTFIVREPARYSGKTQKSWTSLSESVKGNFALFAAGCLGRKVLTDGDAIEDLIGRVVVLSSSASLRRMAPRQQDRGRKAVPEARHDE